MPSRASWPSADGPNFARQNTWGDASPALYAPAQVTGSANGKPDGNSFIIEAGWLSFGKADSWARPLTKLTISLEFIIYTRFNGGTKDYDERHTLLLYAWLAF
jgi:hypothetical protein